MLLKNIRMLNLNNRNTDIRINYLYIETSTVIVTILKYISVKKNNLLLMLTSYFKLIDNFQTLITIFNQLLLKKKLFLQLIRNSSNQKINNSNTDKI